MNEKILLIYKSSTGFTKRYAEWIADETGAALLEYQKRTLSEMAKYDIVIFGSRAHAGRIDGLQAIRDCFPKSGARKLILFVTGAMPNTAEDVVEAFWKQNLTEEEFATAPHFYMQGGLCYERMSVIDRLMMKAAAAMMKRKKDKNAQDLAFEQAIRSSYDISSKEYARPLISYLKEYGQSHPADGGNYKK